MSLTKHIEKKWVQKWQDAHLFEADPDTSRQKKMVTFPFPYMNGPLHVGHAFTATRVDAYVRFKRMQGFNVLWPWAWHWTGQPLLGASQRVAKGDEDYIRVLREVDGVLDFLMIRRPPRSTPTSTASSPPTPGSCRPRASS